jgi:hypothetical protein
MPFETESSNWSGEGQFTQLLLERLRDVPQIRAVRVEDAPSTRSDADYQFISNELFVDFASETRRERVMRFGFLPVTRTLSVKMMKLAELEAALSEMADVGPPDYSDEGMLQYLRAERVVPPYQTRGYKLVELVRIYEAGAAARLEADARR